MYGFNEDRNDEIKGDWLKWCLLGSRRQEEFASWFN